MASPGVIGLKSFSGVELLIHVGLNTCKLIGESFKPQVETGDTISRGQILLTFDPKEVIRAGFDATTPVVVTNPENFGDIIFLLGEQIIHLTNENSSDLKRKMDKISAELLEQNLPIAPRD